jgi:hypothetical protein
MKHPHEVPRRIPDFTWMVAKAYMAGMYPTVHTEITPEVEQAIVADLLVNVMTKENNAHVYLNAYREAIYEKLFKLGRHEEYGEARTRIEEIKRKVRTEQSRVFDEEKKRREACRVSLPRANLARRPTVAVYEDDVP